MRTRQPPDRPAQAVAAARRMAGTLEVDGDAAEYAAPKRHRTAAPGLFAELRERIADRVPITLRAGHWAPPLAAATGLALVVVVAVAVIALRGASSAAGASAVQPLPARSELGGAANPAAVPAPTILSGGSGGTVSSTGASAVGGQATGILLVHVVGQVAQPGVVKVPAGARVEDALQAAGGALPSADLAAVNLARPVVDGEQLMVPRPGEAVTVAAGPAAPGAGSPAALVDLNTADARGLESLPGVGPVLAQRILDWRSQHRRFTSVDELGEVSGIGPKLLAQLRPKVRV